MSRRRKECMINTSEKWSMEFFQHQEEWDQQPMWSTKEYPQWLPRRHSAGPSIASDANWAMCLRGARSNIHHPTTSPDTMDLACHKSWVSLHWTEPTYIQPPCIYSTSFVSPFDELNFPEKIIIIIKLQGDKKSISAVVKINFHSGKNHFSPLCHPQTSVPATRALIWLVSIRGKTFLVGSDTWKMAGTQFRGYSSLFAGIALIWFANFRGKCSNFGGNVN